MVHTQAFKLINIFGAMVLNRSVDTHAQLILYADSRTVRLELTKLNRYVL